MSQNNSCNNLIEKLKEFHNKYKDKEKDIRPPLDHQDVDRISLDVIDVFMSEKMLLQLKAPLFICGDIHGQFFDLVEIFEKCGEPGNDNSYLFLGDYVDRGLFGLETLCLLYAYKVKYPNNIFLLRGNHEFQETYSTYGFTAECEMKNIDLYCIERSFQQMPLAAVINTRIFCCHGGISKKLKYLQNIEKIKRPLTEVSKSSLEEDLLWSDPKKGENFSFNKERGCSVYFGEKNVEDFLENTKIQLIIRAHQLVMEGFETSFDNNVLTVFSAPCYTGTSNNKGAVLYVNSQLKIDVYQFRKDKLEEFD